ncbi:MAG: hypothetical protein CMJ49_11305 [Planctomycetaceae bacterium]|nr:hypothetical protein [Planctomycetaceae bacterium]
MIAARHRTSGDAASTTPDTGDRLHQIPITRVDHARFAEAIRRLPMVTPQPDLNDIMVMLTRDALTRMNIR